jgi:hypothetical protein
VSADKRWFQNEIGIPLTLTAVPEKFSALPVREHYTVPRRGGKPSEVLGSLQRRLGVRGRKTRSEYMFSELPRIADIVAQPWQSQKCLKDASGLKV